MLTDLRPPPRPRLACGTQTSTMSGMATTALYPTGNVDAPGAQWRWEMPEAPATLKRTVRI